MTMHLHPYGIVNGCLLSMGTDQVANYIFSCIDNECSCCLRQSFLCFSHDIQAVVRDKELNSVDMSYFQTTNLPDPIFSA